jgi:hypothetical protein
VALGRTVVDEIARRTAPVPTPLRRGAAAVAVTGGALSLAAVASSIPFGVGPLPVEPVQNQVDPSVVAAAAVLPISDPSTEPDTDAEAGDRPTALVPVATPTRTVDAEVLDTAKLVKAVQLAEREAGRAGTSDHPSGKALDFMVDRATGNALAACALRDQKALGVSYVIWRQRINFGSGWKPMEDRGGVTANHFDHVHVSFESAAGGRPTAC